jgi:hypothetical protein
MHRQMRDKVRQAGGDASDDDALVRVSPRTHAQSSGQASLVSRGREAELPKPFFLALEDAVDGGYYFGNCTVEGGAELRRRELHQDAARRCDERPHGRADEDRRPKGHEQISQTEVPALETPTLL